MYFTMKVLLAIFAFCLFSKVFGGSIYQDAGKISQPNEEKNRQQPKYESAEFWKQSAQDELLRKEQSQPQETQAKNIIFYLGDGMSVPTVAAGRVFKGQKVDDLPFGEEGELHLDSFPFIGTSKTFCADAQVADSACSATAYLCGVKGRIGTIGVTTNVTLLNCAAQGNSANHLPSVLAWAQAAGKSTGIVTNTGITHATPAGTYAHVALRAWENDAIVRISLGNPDICEDIAKQLITREPGRNFNVILGGGLSNFVPMNETDPAFPEGDRLPGVNLIKSWISAKNASNASFITTRDQLLAIDPTTTEYLMGLFSSGHLPYNDGRTPEEMNSPSLEEMVSIAIGILNKNPNGYFLFVEGGRIDTAHHDNAIQRALWEVVEFDKAIKKGDDLSQDEETLIVVTSDHAHVMQFGGHAERGSPILGHGDRLASDGLPYGTLSYGNGGQNWIDPDTGKRIDISDHDFENIDYRPPVPVSMLESESHGGEDVLIFAKGPWGHLFEGVHQQSYIPHAIGYAACLGTGAKFCDGK